MRFVRSCWLLAFPNNNQASAESKRILAAPRRRYRGERVRSVHERRGRKNTAYAAGNGTRAHAPNLKLWSVTSELQKKRAYIFQASSRVLGQDSPDHSGG